MFQEFHQGGANPEPGQEEKVTKEEEVDPVQVTTEEVQEQVTKEVTEDTVQGEEEGQDEYSAIEEVTRQEEVTGEDEGQQGQSPGFMSTVLKAFTGNKEPEGTQKPEVTIMNGGGGGDPTRLSNHTHKTRWRRRQKDDKIYLEFTDEVNAILPNDDTEGFNYEFIPEKKENIENIIKNHVTNKNIYQLIKIYENLIIKIKKIEHDINYDSQIKEDEKKKLNNEKIYYVNVIEVIEENTRDQDGFKKAKTRAEDRAKQIGLEVFLNLTKDGDKIETENNITEIINGNTNAYKKLDGIKIPLKIFESSYSTAALLYQILMIIIKKDDFNIYHKIPNRDTDLYGPQVLTHLCKIMTDKKLLNEGLQKVCDNPRESGLVNPAYSPVTSEVTSEYAEARAFKQPVIPTVPYETTNPRVISGEGQEETAAAPPPSPPRPGTVPIRPGPTQPNDEQINKYNELEKKINDFKNKIDTLPANPADNKDGNLLLKYITNSEEFVQEIGRTMRDGKLTVNQHDELNNIIKNIKAKINSKQKKIPSKNNIVNQIGKLKKITKGGAKKTKKNKASRGGSSKKRRTLKKFD
jgi:hypothetical protein